MEYMRSFFLNTIIMFRAGRTGSQAHSARTEQSAFTIGGKMHHVKHKNNDMTTSYLVV